jgi:hypothetical protein
MAIAALDGNPNPLDTDLSGIDPDRTSLDLPFLRRPPAAKIAASTVDARLVDAAKRVPIGTSKVYPYGSRFDRNMEDARFIYPDGSMHACHDSHYIIAEEAFAAIGEEPPVDPDDNDAVTQPFMMRTRAVRVSENNSSEVSVDIRVPITPRQVRVIGYMARGKRVFWDIGVGDGWDSGRGSFGQFQRALVTGAMAKQAAAVEDDRRPVDLPEPEERCCHCRRPAVDRCSQCGSPLCEDCVTGDEGCP